MHTKTKSIIRNADFLFENSPVMVIANRNSSEIKLAGLGLGPFEEGNEYEVYRWAALELQKSGMAHFREDEAMDSAKLNKIQWTERVQAAGQISRLPDDLYPRIRRYLTDLKNEIAKAPERMRDYERVKQLTQDIVNSRVKKIIALASAPTRTEHMLKNLTEEERFLYEKLYQLISDWRIDILEYTEEIEQ